MSWINKIDNVKFSITTGDGKQYFPLWKTGETSKEFNTSTFDFINVPKSLVERKKPKSGKFPLTFWFQGDDNLEQADAFYNSADDSRVWTITHPFYNTIKGQPISISRNDTNFNITEITVDFWESIDVDYPTSNFSVKDNTYAKKQEVLSLSATTFASKDVFKAVDIQKMKTSNAVIASSMTNVVTDKSTLGTDIYSDYVNALAKAQKSSDNLIDNSYLAIQNAQSLLDLPSTVESDVSVRLFGYKTSFSKLKGILLTVADKLFFQSQGATCIASYCNAAVNPIETDYKTIIQLEQVSTDLLSIYEEYLTILDNSSVSNYDVVNTFNPDPSIQNELYSLVMFTIGNLFNLGVDSKRERVVFTDRNTNLILLAHRYLGLDANDENIENFRIVNNIKLNEIFRIKKGRKIKYFV